MNLNLGIIGAGSAVRRLHWPVLRNMTKEFRIIAIYSRTPVRAEDLAREVGGARVYEDYHHVLDDPQVDAVLIAVPIEMNGRILTEAIAANKHVLAEKPIAATLCEADAVLHACEATCKVVAIAENFRYREDVAMAREAIARGEIGTVCCFSMTTKYDSTNSFRRAWFEKGTWRHSPAFPGGMIADTGIHAVSSLHDILGAVRQVFAQTLRTSTVTDGADALLAQFTLADGVVGHFLACYTAKVAEESALDLTVFGTHGSLRLREGEVEWISTPDMKTTCYRPEHYDRGYTQQWKNFHRASCGEENLLSTPRLAYRDLVTLDAILRSGASGNKVILDAPVEG